MEASVLNLAFSQPRRSKTTDVFPSAVQSYRHETRTHVRSNNGVRRAASQFAEMVADLAQQDRRRQPARKVQLVHRLYGNSESADFAWTEYLGQLPGPGSLGRSGSAQRALQRGNARLQRAADGLAPVDD